MGSLDLAAYLRTALRHRWVIVPVVLLGLLVGAAVHLVTAPSYEASASVLLLPNDPAERVTAAPGGYFDPNRYSAAQVAIMSSPEIADGAAALLEGEHEVDGTDVLESTTVAGESGTDVVTVTATAPAPVLARDMANAVANAYIESRRTAAVEGLEAAAAGIDTQLAALEEQIGALQDGSAPSSSASLEAVTLQYNSLFTQRQDLLIDISLKRGEARLIGPAALPSAPVGVSTAQAMLLGGLLGLMAGLALAYVRELTDRTRRDEGGENHTGLPVLAALPPDRRTRESAGHVATVSDPASRLAESVRGLRSSIESHDAAQPVRRLVVTSALAGEGRTTTALNLAAALARSGVRTVLVSADVRRPQAERVLGIATEDAGLTEVVEAAAARRVPATGEPRTSDHPPAALADLVRGAVLRTATEDLWLLPAGASVPDPRGLLGSSGMVDVLAELDATFDMVVVDGPPLLGGSDAVALVHAVGTVVVITAPDTTGPHPVGLMMDILRSTDADVIGVVLNDVGAASAAAAPERAESGQGLRGFLTRAAHRLPRRTTNGQPAAEHLPLR